MCRLVAVDHTAVPPGFTGKGVGCSRSYCSPGRAYWAVGMLVAVGHTAVPVGHTGWGGRMVVIGQTGWCVGLLR